MPSKILISCSLCMLVLSLLKRLGDRGLGRGSWKSPVVTSLFILVLGHLKVSETNFELILPNVCILLDIDWGQLISHSGSTGDPCPWCVTSVTNRIETLAGSDPLSLGGIILNRTGFNPNIQVLSMSCFFFFPLNDLLFLELVFVY